MPVGLSVGSVQVVNAELLAGHYYKPREAVKWPLADLEMIVSTVLGGQGWVRVNVEAVTSPVTVKNLIQEKY